jgi:hypothetical protein
MSECNESSETEKLLIGLALGAMGLVITLVVAVNQLRRVLSAATEEARSARSLLVSMDASLRRSCSLLRSTQRAARAPLAMSPDITTGLRLRRSSSSNSSPDVEHN